MLNILAFSCSSVQGGAQTSTIEFLELIKQNGIPLRIVICKDANLELVSKIRSLNVTYRVISNTYRSGFPLLKVDDVEEWIKWADIVWITDVEFLIAPQVKIIKNVPIIAHLRSYPLICPWWGLLYGMKEVCNDGCGLTKIIRCKQIFNRELSKLGIMGSVRSNFYQVLDFAKGPFDYLAWRSVVGKKILNSIDGFIAVSYFVKMAHQRLLPVDNKPIEVVYNPIIHPFKHTEKLVKTEEDREDHIVYASGSSPTKGSHTILQALRVLLQEDWNIKLVMFNCKNTWVEKYAEKLGVKDHVVFMGRVPFSKLYEAMYKARVVVMPSIWPEPFGRVPVEANRLGTLAVVTNRGGLPEAIADGETGFVVEATPESLAAGIERAMKLNKEREFVQRMSLSRINPRESVSKLLKFFESVL